MVYALIFIDSYECHMFNIQIKKMHMINVLIVHYNYLFIYFGVLYYRSRFSSLIFIINNT